MTPEMKDYINAWLQKANNDLLSAQPLLEIEPAILDSFCFHCQQSIEKDLKAYLIYNGVDIERTHNIIFLSKECASFNQIFSTIEPMNINMYAVQPRYPNIRDLPEPSEAHYYYELAIRIKQMVAERISLN